MRDATSRERALLADLRGDLNQTPQEGWLAVVQKYEASFGVEIFVSPCVSIHDGWKTYGHSLGVVGTWPRDHRSLQDKEQNNFCRLGQRITWRREEQVQA